MPLIPSPNLADTNMIYFETRLGNPIENSQSLVISQFCKNQFSQYRTKYKNIHYRTKPTGFFNCHGLTFGSRRAEITNPAEVKKILTDDQYIQVNRDDALPGDVILYYSNGDIEHSGILTTKPDPPLYVPLVYSKWGSYCEIIHLANNCPYDYSQTQFYRITE